MWYLHVCSRICIKEDLVTMCCVTFALSVGAQCVQRGCFDVMVYSTCEICVMIASILDCSGSNLSDM